MGSVNVMRFYSHIGRRLIAYCDGSLGHDERARIEEHLGSCARCLARLGRIRASIRFTRQLPLLDPADELWGRIEERLSSDIRTQLPRELIRERRLGFGGSWLLRPATFLAFLAIVVTAVFLISHYGLPPGARTAEF